jgi:hypothetical protein
MRNVRNWLLEGSRLNCSGCRTSEVNEDNLNNVRRKAGRYFRKERMEYLEDRINELLSNSKNRNFRNF